MKQDGYQIVSEAIQQTYCTLLTGTGEAGKTTISHKLAKQFHLSDVIELDEVMRQLVKRKHPQLKSFYKEDLISYFGDIKKAKKVMWGYQLPALKISLAKYSNSNVLIEGMVIYQPNAYSLIDKFKGQIYVIRPINPNEFLNKRIKYSKMNNYNLSSEQKKSILEYYKREIIGLKKFIRRYKDKIEFVDN